LENTRSNWLSLAEKANPLMNPWVKKTTLISILILSAFSYLGFVWESRKSYFPTTNQNNSKEIKSTHVSNLALNPLSHLGKPLFPLRNWSDQEAARHTQKVILARNLFSHLGPICNVRKLQHLPHYDYQTVCQLYQSC
jgi:hypothetical protein